MNRSVTAVWNGTIKEGKGNLTTQSGILNTSPYSFVSRFESGAGTNPEELLAAAHAGCFTMKLSAELTSAGYNPEELSTTSTITLLNGVTTRSDLVLTAKLMEFQKVSFKEFQKFLKKPVLLVKFSI